MIEDQIERHTDLGWSALKNGSWQIYDHSGNTLNDAGYEAVISSANLFGVKLEGKWGVLNDNGEELITSGKRFPKIYRQGSLTFE